MIQRWTSLQHDDYPRPHESRVEVPLPAHCVNEGDGKRLSIRQTSLRSKRGVFTMACTAFTIGGLLIVFSSPYRNEFLAPGPLTSHHSQILAGQGADRCAACHSVGNQSFAAWIQAAFTGGSLANASSDGSGQSDLCLNCHYKTMAASHAMFPHNVPPKELSALSDKYPRAGLGIGKLVGGPVGHSGQIACSACHREHQGDVSLSRMTDQQCQTCHRQSYHSFETDHPEFTNWPVQRRSRIAFDHTSHVLRHFPEKGATFDCNTCHVDDSSKNVKMLAPYEQSCALCHDSQIRSSSHDGVHRISLPMLDLKSISTARLNAGEWPAAATGDFDGSIPPVMRALLCADENINAIFQRLGPQFEFADIDPANAEQVNDAVELAWGIKQLLLDLAEQGPSAISARLQLLTGRQFDSDQLRLLTAGLDAEVLQNAARRWFPSLKTEMLARVHHVPQPQTLVLPLGQDVLNYYGDDSNDLLALNPLKGLINQKPLPTIPADASPELKSGPGLISGPAPVSSAQQSATVVPNPQRLINVHADPKNDPQLLAENPLASLAQGATVPGLAQPPAVPQPQFPLVAETCPSPISAPDDRAAPVAIGASSGWFRDDQLYRISYRPVGHQDQLLKSWIDLATSIAEADTRTEFAPLFRMATATSGVGTCLNCHSADKQSDNTWFVNWQAQYRDPSVGAFARFSHGPHLVQPHLRDCKSCHELNPQSANADTFGHFNPAHAVSNFFPITKSNCTSCHASGLTDNGCTQCHNYHVGSKIVVSQ